MGADTFTVSVDDAYVAHLNTTRNGVTKQLAFRLREMTPPGDYVLASTPGTFDVTAYGARGDLSPDDTAGIAANTAAIQAAVTAALSAASAGGAVYFPPPKTSYYVSDTILVNGSGLSLVGAAPGALDAPVFTQTVYGKTIFRFIGSRSTIRNLSGQYGKTTVLAQPVAVNATTLVVANASTIAANDWLILDQATTCGGSGLLEQVQVLSVAGNTITLQSSTPVTLAHAAGVWVRDQATVSGSLDGDPGRDAAGFAVFNDGDACGVIDCAVVAMVTAVKFRGVRSSNQLNNLDNFVKGLITNFVQFGALSKQQTRYTLRRIRFYNATGGQTTAPGHGFYLSTNTGLSGTWLSGKTYNQFDQVSFGGVQYVALVGNNVGHQPDVSPTFWGLGRTDAQPGYLSFSYEVQILDFIADPGFDFKDWSAGKAKNVIGGVFSSFNVIHAVRAIDMEQCTDVEVSSYSFSKFIVPNGSDSSAAAINLLNCVRCAIRAGTVDLTQDDGTSAIDMPAVLNRVSTSLGANPLTAGSYNTFSGVVVFSNFSSGFTSAAFRNTGGKHNQFIGCTLIERGGQNNYVYRFSQDNTAQAWPGGCRVVNPIVDGATNIVTVDANTTSPADATIAIEVSLDPNLLPLGYKISDPGGGAVTSYSYVPKITASGPANGTALLPGTVNRFGSGQTGNNYPLPDASTVLPLPIYAITTNSGGRYTYQFTPAAGTVNGATSYVVVADHENKVVVFIPDGTNWWAFAMPIFAPYAPRTPAMHTMIEWNGDPAVGGGGTGALTSGSLYVFQIRAQGGKQISNVEIVVGTLGSGFSNENSAAVFDASGNQISKTADQATPWASTGRKSMALAAPFTPKNGDILYVAVLCNATTPIALRIMGSNNLLANVGFSTTSASNEFGVAATSQTTMPSSITPANITQTGSVVAWVGLS